MILNSLISLFAQSLLAVTHQESLDRLMEGNRHYVQDHLMSGDTGSYRRNELISKQKPFAVILGCADSRVPPEIIFDQGIGDLFVVRVAGQVAGPFEIDSIDYAVKILGSSLILVLGHESCGAVHAVMTGNTADIKDIADFMQPAIKGIQKADTEKGVKANVRWNVDYLKKTPVVQKLIQQGKLNVIGGYYTLSDGHVEILDK